MYLPLAKKDQPPTLENLVAARVMQYQANRFASPPPRPECMGVGSFSDG